MEQRAEYRSGAVSSERIWECKHCGGQLGRVRDGLLVIGSATIRGRAEIRCSTCGRVRSWHPAEEHKVRRLEDILHDYQEQMDDHLRALDAEAEKLRRCAGKE